jgi:hypothetical protein
VSYETVVEISGNPAAQGEERTEPDNRAVPDGTSRVCIFRDQAGEPAIVLELSSPYESIYAGVTSARESDVLDVPAKYEPEGNAMYVDSPEGMLVVRIVRFEVMGNARPLEATLAREFLASA